MAGESVVDYIKILQLYNMITFTLTDVIRLRNRPMGVLLKNVSGARRRDSIIGLCSLTDARIVPIVHTMNASALTNTVEIGR